MREIRALTILITLICVNRFAQADPNVPTTPADQKTADQKTIVLEAEAAEQHGTMIAATRPAYSGSGYVTGIDGDADHFTFHFSAPAAGLYSIEMRYSSEAIKGFDFSVNGLGRSDFFPPTGDAFATHNAGKVELLAGNNTIDFTRGWGFYEMDRIELFPTKIAPLKKPPATLTNPAATDAAKDLFKHLVDQYGEKTLAGVFSQEDADIVKQHANVLPAIMGGDLMDYSPSRLEHGSKPEGTVEKLIANAKAGYILTVMWHWNAPRGLVDKMIMKDGKEVDARWYRGFNTEASTFDLAAALDDPNGADYKLLLRDIDAIAEQLKKFQDANVPILWRPLHEADGQWFWWGAKGADSFKRLWSLMHDRLTKRHHLNNLIWVYTGSEKLDWYPPSDQFDVIGVDLYPHDPHDPWSGIWDFLNAHFGGQKLLTIAEYGGVPDLAVAKKLGVSWSYFNSWTGPLGPGKYDAAELDRLYHAPTIGTR